ncbi:hypothetical protein A3844_10190 [Paenibacillus helianthi]|uniref:Lipoprotein n=2 Tax=Paenibacillus TaxID=44249 RepID=A0ABX3ESI4_9BACL|nr:hypothetical protein [Paenibacillus helianthi]OKP87766.1 hypothetical protein A3844_10190 [Paenibacillus helianthi]OKP93430.1 hypothetical protein A3848_05520 [Paenibacillus sp. P32E]
MIIINKNKKILLNIFLLSMFITFSGCDDSHTGIVEIMGGKEKIEFKTLNNTEKGSSLNDTKKIFLFAFEGGNSKKIKFLKSGDEISLDFGSNPPDKLSISDGLINSNGDYLYTPKEIVEVPYVKKKGIYSFKLETHIASRLSSYYKKDKTVFRGFIIDAFWGNGEYKYAFVIESNAL